MMNPIERLSRTSVREPLDPRPSSDRTARLAALRASVEAAAVGAGGGFKAVVYALTCGNEPVGTLARVKAYAVHRGWEVSRSLHDTCGMTDPVERPGWLEAMRLVAGGFAQVVVTLDRSAVSCSDVEYEEALAGLRTYRSFLAHVPADWQG
jgi:hypothetical protein